LADDIAAERDEISPRFLPRSSDRPWNIDARGMRFAAVGRNGHAARLELGKERFELLVRDHFHLVHHLNDRLVVFGHVA
jgi:hypothetical protein